MTGIELRLVDEVTGAALHVDSVGELEAETAGRYVGELARVHCLATGHPVVLEVFDPAGDIGPPGTWVRLERIEPWP